ncbi:ubiquitin-ligase E3 [Micractinium conductrix]|uniref:Ubiquitin-ligase E3 n=1 Tax=Micractinium conductrix TaxID=554055 RepID=A0A2P6VPX5_9CHLO|nr:ubiquitin-ligase E3 [Micractinium conductrix]|eukprot:PSC76156.1 ubiquitin-ligase E3 [Micractinium conductrix]
MDDEGGAAAEPPPPLPAASVPLASPTLASAASLSRVDLPLAPALAPPIDGLASSDSEAAPAALPAPPPGASPLRAASLRLLSAAAVQRPGTEVYAWGRGDCGQLGSGSAEDSAEPRLVEGLQGRDVVGLAGGRLHTAAVTADGELYTWGANDSHQLGVRGPEQEVAPARVAQLEAFGVQAAASGTAHTLAVVDEGALAAWGSNEFGQCAQPEATMVEQPKLAKELRGLHIVRAAAGGNHSLSLSSTGGVFSFGAGGSGELGRGTAEDPAVPRPISRLWPLGIVQVAAGESHSAALTAGGAVLTWGRGKYGALGPGDVENRSVPQRVRALAGVRGVQLACGHDHTVLLVAGGGVHTWGSRIVGVTVPAQDRLGVRQALQALLERLPPDVLAALCVRPVQRHIDSCVSAGLGATRVQVLMAGVLLDIVRQAAAASGGRIPYTEFHNRSLSEHANLQVEYLAWVSNKDAAALVSICQARIMHGEAALQQQQHLSAAAMQALFQGVNPASVAFLHISVRRTHVVEDALNQLVHRAEDLKKPLKVTFYSGGVPEPAQDEGGVAKEFFQLLTLDLFKPEYGMFLFDEQTRTYWFNAASLEAEVEYALVGAVLGLAIYNGVILDVHFPMVVYKKLLGAEPTFDDLRAAFPELGRGLQQLLDYEGDVESVFCRNFTVEYDFYGERRTEELAPGGADVPVTAANRADYVQKYTKWVPSDGVREQFKAFRSGFLKVCNGPALTLFTPAELELLVCGLPHLDFEALQRVAKDHPAVRSFWEVLQGLSLEQQRAFLQFTTGSDRPPIGGLAKLPLLIQRAGPDTDRLPAAHTCFNALLLPEYAGKAKLRAKLLAAVEYARGFGLQ